MTATADEVSENLEPGTMRNPGLDYGSLAGFEKRLIEVTIQPPARCW